MFFGVTVTPVHNRERHDLLLVRPAAHKTPVVAMLLPAKQERYIRAKGEDAPQSACEVGRPGRPCLGTLAYIPLVKAPGEKRSPHRWIGIGLDGSA